MLSNYFKVAIRNIGRNKLYAAINIVGLAMGLTLFIFGNLIANYEYSHDAFYENSEHIYTLRGQIAPGANMGVNQIDNVQAAFGPIIKAELTDIEAIARTINREYLVTVGDTDIYEIIRYADPELLQIFDFEYIEGDQTALNSSTDALITEEIADKFFQDENPIGKTISLNHEHDLTVSGVIRKPPANSHFSSKIPVDNSLGILVPMNAMQRIADFEPDTNWGNTSSGNLTYVMLPPHLDQQWLETQLDGIYERHYPEDRRGFLSGIFPRPLTDANTAMWDMIGIPIIDIIAVLGLLVLFVACVNYTNLATAQSMARAREVGLRKTLGAGKGQLLVQFITESITITFIAMVFALAVLEAIIPMFNSATGKILAIDYANTLPWIVLTVIGVGLFAGAYPSYLITKTNPIEALRDTARKGRSASWIRAAMIAVQFTISVCILASVLVVYAQNQQVEENSRIFPKDQIYTLDRLDVEQMEDRHETLRNQMLTIPYVENFTLSSQVPYEQTNSSSRVSADRADVENGTSLSYVFIDDQFVDTFNIPLVEGRNFDKANPADTQTRERNTVNVLLNELGAKQLGFTSAQDAVGNVFYEDEGEEYGITTYTVIGVLEDRNLLGLFTDVKPYYFIMRDAYYRVASLTIAGNAPASVVNDIEDVWQEVYPDYPMQGKFLNETFQMIFVFFETSTKALAGFALFALFLAAIGLFGLAAYMAEQKTREIGIRKALGANNGQIVKLLIWQFSKPVLWATPVGLALAYLTSKTYLDLFVDRISLPFDLLFFAGLIGLVIAWATVASHAYKVARTNPVNALHYE